MVIGILAFTCKDEERLAKDQTDKAINLSVEIYFWQERWSHMFEQLKAYL
ncbi:hypothetical protein [Acinetobacter nosocomialis]|nr:hypothetical protein [Acinetobacter nosocomialis]